ncbi:MAG: ion transporter [Proteobacteria bacterium]|nr:ion transporter [Pseudomonadota bacterium]MBU1686386.1 ion transporter [Pseudomonadota bacterium]
MTEQQPPNWRDRMHEIIFEADTRAGKTFDVVLIVSIIASVVTVILESVVSIRAVFGPYLSMAEWFFTIVFTIEYLLRISCVGRPLRYATSFFGIVDLLAVIPTYASLLIPGSQSLIAIRTLRLLRTFRVFKLSAYLAEARVITTALAASSRKIGVFLSAVITIVIIIGTLMYVIEGEEHGFTSIPASIYWAIVTMTTVGYGDISPQTSLGKALASLVMIIGYGIIAVPTGIVTMEMNQAAKKTVSTQSCPQCAAEGHDHDATHCKYCGSPL